jgi:hypothetical protein
MSGSPSAVVYAGVLYVEQQEAGATARARSGVPAHCLGVGAQLVAVPRNQTDGLQQFASCRLDGFDELGR